MFIVLFFQLLCRLEIFQEKRLGEKGLIEKITKFLSQSTQNVKSHQFSPAPRAAGLPESKSPLKCLKMALLVCECALEWARGVGRSCQVGT